MGKVSKVCLVGISRTIVKSLGGWIVLDDITVPVCNPDGTIGSYFSKHRREPFISTSHQVKAFLVVKISAFFLHVVLVQDMAGGFCNKSNAVPIFFREGPRGIKIMTGCGGESTEGVHLTHLFGDGFHVPVSVCAPAAVGVGRIEIGMGNGHVPSM